MPSLTQLDDLSPFYCIFKYAMTKHFSKDVMSKHIKKDRASHVALRPEIGQMAKTFGFVYSWKTLTMALTAVTKRITPSAMFIDLGFAFIYLKTNPVI